MEKWAVEARIFNNGKIVVKVRKPFPDEEEGCTDTRICDVWVDFFETEEAAEQFAADYRRA